MLDTNVISEFARPDNKSDQRVKQWLEAADSNSLYASVLTFGRSEEELKSSLREGDVPTWKHGSKKICMNGLRIAS
ncbi:MAG TPA: hypothetical protein VNW97_10680 [Candidatus Saccharimonadales bacterium]|nr:hypothetical protein [Candidatus Saccharimonadales bacterium]